MRAPQHPGTALQSRSLLLTVEPVDSPHLILGDGLFASQGGIDVHEGVGVQRVHEAQGVSDLVGCHMDQVCEPNSWGKRKTSWNCASCQSTNSVCSSALSHNSSWWKTRGKTSALERATVPQFHLPCSCLGPNRANYFHVLPISSSSTQSSARLQESCSGPTTLTRCNSDPPQLPAHFVPTALS